MRHRIIRTKGQRIAWTNTSRIPDADVVDGIKFVAQYADLDKVVIHVKKSTGRSGSGWAYPAIPVIANLDGLKRWEWQYLITVSQWSFISTLAHEAKHIEQFKEDLKVSEIPARAFAAWVFAQKETAPEGAVIQAKHQ